MNKIKNKLFFVISAFCRSVSELLKSFAGQSKSFRELCRLFKDRVKRLALHPLLWCFLLPLLLMLCVFIAIGVFPFGKNSVLVLDLNGQYVYFFEALRSFIYGDSSILYSFSRALGGEFLGIYAYYLASPLSYIVALFPKSCITEALFTIILLKMGLCGLSFGYLLHKKAKTREITTIIFSCVYALSAYVVIMQHNTMWIDNVFMLPLIVLGVDALVCERKYKLFVFSLVWAVVSNYYIGYMTCIFTFLYFFFSYFSQEPSIRNPRKKKCHFLRSFAYIGVFSVISMAIASIIILPAYYSLTFGKTTFSDPNFVFKTRFDILDLLTKFLFGAYDTVRPEGLPNVYCGIVTLFLVPIYFISDKVSMREKICNIILSLVLVFSFSINTLDLVWHGFQAPNWLNYRYSYMLIFLMVYMAARGFENIRSTSKTVIYYISFVLIITILFLPKAEYKHLHFFFAIISSIICVTAYLFVFNYIISNKNLPYNFLSKFLLAVVSLELFLSGLYNTCSLDYDVVISDRESYVGYMDKWEGAAEYIKQDNSPFFRVEKTNYRKVNDSYTLGYRGLSGSTSTLNAHTVDFISVFGHNSSAHSSRYTGSTVMADSFFSIKYIMAENENMVSNLYTKRYSDENVSVYENPYVLPVAFGVSENVNGLTFSTLTSEEGKDREYYDDDSPFNNLNKLYSTLLGSDEVIEFYKPIESEISKFNCQLSTSRIKFYPTYSGIDSTLTFTFEGVGDNGIYAYFPTLHYTGAEMLLNGRKIGSLFGSDNHGFVYVGQYPQGEKAELTFRLTDEGIYLIRYIPYFYYLDEALFESAYETLTKSAYKVEKCTEDYFYGSINVSDGQNVILTTIPYDKGWQVVANGEKVETYETLDALLAFELDSGEYKLELKYMPEIYIIAFWISLAGTVTLFCILITELLLKKTKKIKAEEQSAEKE